MMLLRISGLLGLVVSALASCLAKNATLTQRAETGVSEIAGSWVAWQEGYLSR
jgi:hypothetical protein